MPLDPSLETSTSSPSILQRDSLFRLLTVTERERERERERVRVRERAALRRLRELPIIDVHYNPLRRDNAA